MENDTKDQLNEDYVSIQRLLKGVVVRSDKIGTELIKAQQTLGEGFAEFVRTRLPFDLREAQLFMDLATTPGLEVANFTPPVDVKLPRLLEVYGQILGIWATINGGTGAPDESPAMACAGSANTAAVESIASATSDGTKHAAPPANDSATDNGAIGTAKPDNLSGLAVATPTAAIPAACQEITADQRRFLAARSVSLLMKLTKGEITPEAAMRQAEKLPVRNKGKKSLAGSR